jgi:hypothetical protein
VGSVGDLTFEVGFVITAAVYLTWHAIAKTGREKTLADLGALYKTGRECRPFGPARAAGAGRTDSNLGGFLA